MTLRDCFKQTRTVSCAAHGHAVEATVVRAMARDLAPGAGIQHAEKARPRAGLFRVAVLPAAAGAAPALRFQMLPDGSGELSATQPAGLYSLFCLVRDRWLERDASDFADGLTVQPSFSWLRNLNDFFVGSLRSARHFDREAFVRHLARIGFTHLAVNGLGVPPPRESGPPGDVYSCFYDYSPDLDQFVDTPLLRGYYPADYLQANLSFLKRNAALALKYGLTPGLHVNSPRSMPEEFWQRYGFLRGARIDHPRESFRPRYTLAMAHPAVQEHYRQLVRRMMEEVPELGFLQLWTNDSGAGFEFTSMLYAGRNGGPYLIREWKSDEDIARAAARNVLSYFHLLRDEGRKANPGFQLICDLAPLAAERSFIVDGLGGGIDVGEFGSFGEQSIDRDRLAKAGGGLHPRVDTAGTNVIGAPFPRLLRERLLAALATGSRGVLADAAPPSLAPFDVNAEVLRAFQLEPDCDVAGVMTEAAARWVGADRSSALVDLWEASDAALRALPPGIPGSTFAFPWFRFWVRPLVPNIDAIPEPERAYYERFLVATFNNPARVDLNNDMLWDFLTVREAAEKVAAIDRHVLPILDGAVAKAAGLLGTPSMLDPARSVFTDTRDRLLALRCFVKTLRNCMAWTEAVHGYLESSEPDLRQRYRQQSRAMVLAELENAQTLLELWQRSTVDFMPISTVAETPHLHGENFGNLLERKIRLMQGHMDDEPHIPPDYMWRMPAGELTA